MERELVRRGDRPGPGIRPEPRFRAARDVRRVGGYRTLGFRSATAERLGPAAFTPDSNSHVAVFEKQPQPPARRSA
jgi:hypothetical protein